MDQDQLNSRIRTVNLTSKKLLQLPGYKVEGVHPTNPTKKVLENIDVDQPQFFVAST
jgi:hypothetical protein